METNWIIIAAVAIVALALVFYLIRQNQKDKEEVSEFFNSDISEADEDEEEPNDKV